MYEAPVYEAPVVEAPYVAPARTPATPVANNGGITKDYDSKYDDIWEKFIAAKKFK